MNNPTNERGRSILNLDSVQWDALPKDARLLYLVTDKGVFCLNCMAEMDWHAAEDCPSGEGHYWCLDCGNLGEL